MANCWTNSGLLRNSDTNSSTLVAPYELPNASLTLLNSLVNFLVRGWLGLANVADIPAWVISCTRVCTFSPSLPRVIVFVLGLNCPAAESLFDIFTTVVPTTLARAKAISRSSLGPLFAIVSNASFREAESPSRRIVTVAPSNGGDEASTIAEGKNGTSSASASASSNGFPPSTSLESTAAPTWSALTASSVSESGVLRKTGSPLVAIATLRRVTYLPLSLVPKSSTKLSITSASVRTAVSPLSRARSLEANASLTSSNPSILSSASLCSLIVGVLSVALVAPPLASPLASVAPPSASVASPVASVASPVASVGNTPLLT